MVFDLDLVECGLYAENSKQCAFIAFSQIELRFHKSETVFLSTFRVCRLIQSRFEGSRHSGFGSGPSPKWPIC